MDPQLVAKLIESGIKTSVPWSRDYNLTPQIQNINKTLQKSLRVQSRFNSINQQYRVKTLQKQKSLSNSLILSQQRKRMLLSEKQKQISLHSKKVDDKLSKFHNTQKLMLKKATVNQKRFSETISSYWRDKLKQNQLQEKKIYKIYSRRGEGSNSNRLSNSVQLMSADGNNRRNESSLFSSMINHDFEKDRSLDRGDQVRSRMSEISEHKQDNTFQKMMKKLAKIERRKKIMRIKSLKTEAAEDAQTELEDKIGYSSPKMNKKSTSKNKIRIRDKILSSNSFLRQRKILPYHLQNKQVRESIQQNSFDQHTQYLEGYKHRMKQLNNIRELRNKIIQKKLYVQRQQIGNRSLL